MGKKKSHIDEPTSHASVEDDAVSENKVHKKKKKKDKNEQTATEQQHSSTGVVSSHKQKKHKRKRTESMENENSKEHESTGLKQSQTDHETNSSKKRRKKKPHDTSEKNENESMATTQESTASVCETAETESRPKKRKKEKKLRKYRGESKGDDSTHESSQSASGMESEVINGDVPIMREVTHHEKKCKKKRKSSPGMEYEDIEVSCPKKIKISHEPTKIDNIKCEKKSKKRKKDCKEISAEEVSISQCENTKCDQESSEEAKFTECELKSKKKRKKKNKDKKRELDSEKLSNEIDNKEELSNVKNEKQSGLVEDNSLSQDCTNMNSSHPDLVPSVTKLGFGQWGTADVGQAGRQQKFLRLLGGMKNKSDSKGNTPILKKLNMALDKTGEKNLNEKLENQFESARNIVISGMRGGGLGYEAPPDKGKKFYIDSNISKSTKFD